MCSYSFAVNLYIEYNAEKKTFHLKMKWNEMNMSYNIWSFVCKVRKEVKQSQMSFMDDSELFRTFYLSSNEVKCESERTSGRRKEKFLFAFVVWSILRQKQTDFSIEFGPTFLALEYH